jgi:hypothetical protein
MIINELSTEDLQAIIASTSPTGQYSKAVAEAEAELRRRGHTIGFILRIRNGDNWVKPGKLMIDNGGLEPRYKTTFEAWTAAEKAYPEISALDIKVIPRMR